MLAATILNAAQTLGSREPYERRDCKDRVVQQLSQQSLECERVPHRDVNQPTKNRNL